MPAIAVAIKRRVIFFDYTYFTLDEISSVRLSDRTDFTPFLSEGFHDQQQQPRELKNRTNHILYYLRFREFLNYANSRKEKDLPGLTQYEQNQCQNNLIEPYWGSNLWRQEYTSPSGLREILTRGFLAHADACPECITLHELSNVRMSHDDPHVAAARLFVNLLRSDKKLLKQTKTYRGDEIIQRLLEIPVAERNF